MTATEELDTWINQESQVARARMFMNISPTGALHGTIIASPSRDNPNYYYYWVRDGAMVMRSIVGLYEASEGSDRASLQASLFDYVQFSLDNQKRTGQTQAGEPRFNVDGSINTEPWARPQNDGPALRALTMMHFARDLMASGQAGFVQSSMYSAKNPGSVIKADLEFVAHHWGDPCFDLWEEIMGQHFFTRAVQLAALREGATFAQEMSDVGAASFYRTQADALESALAQHWSEPKGYYQITLESQAGADHQKPSGLDSAVVLAALASEQDGGILSLDDGKILATASKLEQAFTSLYGINRNKALGPAIGRYPEDYYFGGNPWVLTTAGFAELNYKLAVILDHARTFPLNEARYEYFSRLLDDRPFALTKGMDVTASPLLKAQLIAALFEKGDSYMQRLKLHVNADGSFAEQIQRDTGFMLSAPDLSWSYAAFLRAVAARESARPF